MDPVARAWYLDRNKNKRADRIMASMSEHSLETWATELELQCGHLADHE